MACSLILSETRCDSSGQRAQAVRARVQLNLRKILLISIAPQFLLSGTCRGRARDCESGNQLKPFAVMSRVETLVLGGPRFFFSVHMRTCAQGCCSVTSFALFIRPAVFQGVLFSSCSSSSAFKCDAYSDNGFYDGLIALNKRLAVRSQRAHAVRARRLALT
jgi:hypothetical protein